MKIAVSGKGGTGKTTLSASLARTFAENGYDVYAIDADPDANLAAVLGIYEPVRPLIDLEELIEERVGGSAGMFTLNPDVDDVLDEYSTSHDGIRFLRMGSVKAASSACYCPENSFLRSVLNSLVFTRNEVVIMDMGAGIEHLTRGTAAGVDVMLIMVEPTRISMQTAEVIEGLAREAGVGEIRVVANKIRSDREREIVAGELGDKLIASVDFDDTLLERALDAGDEESPGLAAADDIFRELVSR